jgi:hypothetical protein
MYNFVLYDKVIHLYICIFFIFLFFTVRGYGFNYNKNIGQIRHIFVLIWKMGY